MRIFVVIVSLFFALNCCADTVEHVWLRNYQPGVPHTINPDQYSSLTEFFAESFNKYKDHPCFENMGKTISYSELDVQSRDFAAFLQYKFKLAKGDRFAIMMPNVLQYPVAMLGILRAGGTVVNINPLYTADELEHQLVDSQATGIIVLESFAHTLAKVIDKTQVQHVIVTRVGDALNPVKALAVNFSVKYIKKKVPTWHIKDRYWFKDVMAQGAKAKYQDPKLSGEDLAFLQYTGGTTGFPKGAMLTHRNMTSNILQTAQMLSQLLRYKREVVFGALPMYHIYAVIATCLQPIYYGSTIVLITNPRDTKSVIKEIKSHKFTGMIGVNTLFSLLLEQPELTKEDFSEVAISMSGGMPLQKSVAERWQQLSNNHITDTYGLTETSPASCMNPSHFTQYTGSVGVPIPSTEISIRDDNNHDIGSDKVGELYIRGPQVMRGYWNKPAETKNVLSEDGWLRTGDIGRIDANGFVYLVDRKKDMINVSGFKVYPNEVEAVIGAMPQILEVAVIGVMSPNHGELVKAFVVKKDQSLTEEAVIAYCREHLTGYKVPKFVEFRDSLPKSNVNKILRRALKEETKEQS